MAWQPGQTDKTGETGQRDQAGQPSQTGWTGLTNTHAFCTWAMSSHISAHTYSDAHSTISHILKSRANPEPRSKSQCQRAPMGPRCSCLAQQQTSYYKQSRNIINSSSILPACSSILPCKDAKLPSHLFPWPAAYVPKDLSKEPHGSLASPIRHI
jgi:hypothetical protein